MPLRSWLLLIAAVPVVLVNALIEVLSGQVREAD